MTIYIHDLRLQERMMELMTLGEGAWYSGEEAKGHKESTKEQEAALREGQPCALCHKLFMSGALPDIGSS